MEVKIVRAELIPFEIAFSAPLIAALISIVLRRWGNYTVIGFLSALASGLGFLSSIILAGNIVNKGSLTIETPWIKSYGLEISHPFYVDELAVFFIIITSFFGFISILYSIGDMAGEGAYPRYYTLMLLFQASMIGLFSSGNLLLLLVFWELVGLCSYLLIGFHKEKLECGRASYKALMVTRVCSTGLIAAILVLLSFNSFRYDAALDIPLLLGSSNFKLLFILPLLLIASMAKSVQFPFHTWLPDATVAPSAVTAYLHAAAMVKAGVYLLARFYYIINPTIASKSVYPLIIATVGTLTLTICTMAAWMQDDVKRVLAYHTCGQIGYMFLGLGVATNLGVAGAILHCLNHAIFKGLLFLGAGSLIYATGTRNLDEMGGLARRMPVTASAMIIGSLSIIGIPPFSGFASKLLIYEGVFERAMKSGGAIGSGYFIYLVLAVLTSAVTLASFAKVLHSAFFGTLPEHLSEVREVPLSMRIPLMLLSGACLFLGVAPQAVIGWIVNPILKGMQIPQVSISYFGYRTTVGWYEASIIAIAILAPLIIGFLAYKLTAKVGREEPGKYELFLGGEAGPPYLNASELRVGSKPFAFSPSIAFRGLYKFMLRGGLDLIYYRFASLIERWGVALLGAVAFTWVAALVLGAFPFQLYIGGLLTLGGTLIAARFSDVKRVIALLSLSQLGYIALELGAANVAGVPEYSKHGVAGAFLHILNFAVAILLLLLCLDNIRRRTGSEDFRMLRGLSTNMPVTSFAFLIGVLSMAGLPPLGGWWSEYYVYTTMIEVGRWDLALASIAASILTLSIALRVFHRIFLGEPEGWRGKAGEGRMAKALMLTLASIIILLGIYPDPFVNLAVKAAGG
jgi:NADH:ubiquinone oxidoreductase subunit 5 (subunit L)/multisubunit Na+/H+ antiporter MnhA subunit